jgi:adenosylhomocysteine nucleosidase
MKDIILIALESEAPDLVNKPGVFFTGVGKINAAIIAARLIERYKPERVFNFGTAGGINVNHGGIYKCTQFTQRDLLPSGCLVGKDLIELTSPIICGMGGLTLSTGDNFVKDPAEALGADLVDMEGYAIAKACYETGTEFICYKYISDRADENAAENFQENMHKGQEYYISVLNEYNVNV